MSAPMTGDMSLLVRVTLYLAGTLHVGVRFPATVRADDRSPVQLRGWSDANCASAETDRKSVSCGAWEDDGCILYNSAQGPAVIATSSAESEIYALTAVADEVIFFTKLLGSWGSALKLPC